MESAPECALEGQTDAPAEPAPISVMHVITGLGFGGAESMLVSLAIGGRERGLDARVVSLLPGGENAERLSATGIPVHDLAMARGRPSLAAVCRLAGLIRRHRPQVVQSWMYHADLVAWAARLLLPSAARPKLAWGIRCSDMRFDLYPRQLRWVVATCARLSGRPDLIVANSQAGRATHQALGYRSERFTVIANGIDTERYRPEPLRRTDGRAALGLAADSIAVALVARVDPMKDHGTFLDAMRRRPELRGFLIGRDTEALVLPGNVTALGARADVAELLPAFDVIALSSAFGEGFPNALAEGMSAGLVPVATDVGDCGLMIGDTGFTTPAGDAEALSAALLRAAERARDGGGIAARARVLDRFTLPHALDAFRNVYCGLVGIPCAA